MTKNSYICRLINDNPDGWESIVKEKGIRITRDEKYPQLAILSYSEFNSDFSDPTVQESRGIIIDTNRAEAVCWPFRKFGNHHVSYADDIDWNTARVQEKIDGSLIKLWHNPFTGMWQFSTNGCIDSYKAPAFDTGYSFGKLITEAVNYRDLDLTALDTDKTYMFELVSPKAKLTIAYPETMLWHIGTRNKETGQESDDYIGIRKPAEYPLRSMDECIEAAINLNKGINTVKAEGFVVVDAAWHRVKVKSPEFIAIHQTLSGGLSKRRAVELIRQHSYDIKGLEESLPGCGAKLYFYAYCMKGLEDKANQYMNYAKRLYDELERDQKAFAKTILKDRLSMFGFKAIRGADDAGEILARMPESTYLSFIPNYKEFDIIN